MEWWTAEMTDTAVRAVLWLVMAVLALWRTGLVAAGHEWAATLKDSRLAAGANKIIDAADQQLSGEAGASKLSWALNTPLARKLRIDRTDIEAALAARNAAQGKVSELAAQLAAANAKIAALQAQLAPLIGPTPVTGDIKYALGASPAVQQATDAAEALKGKLNEIRDSAHTIRDIAESFRLARPGDD